MEAATQISPVFGDLTAETILQDVEQLKPETIAEKAAKYLISPTEEIQPPQVALQQISSGAVVGTLGNFSTLIGKAKSRKSFTVAGAVASMISSTAVFGGLTGQLPAGKETVMVFDTEQSRYHVQLSQKRICKMAGNSDPDNLKVYGLRSLNPQERLEVIEHLLYSTPGIGVVVIDGIKDLINSINDEAEATMIASKLLKWSEELNIHIITVLHQNKSDNNARGHIGTELINKAETVLSVSRCEANQDISIVEPQMCRNREPEPFAFEVNEEGIPVMVEDFEIRTETKSNRYDVIDMEDYRKYQMLTSVFSRNDSYTYSELRIQMQLEFKAQFKKKLGDNRAKELITDCKNNGWLLQEKAKGPYTLGSFDGLSDSENTEDSF